MMRSVFILVLLIWTVAFPPFLYAEDTGSGTAEGQAWTVSETGEAAVDTFIDPYAPFPDEGAAGSVTKTPTGSGDAAGEAGFAPDSVDSSVEYFVNPD